MSGTHKPIEVVGTSPTSFGEAVKTALVGFKVER